MPKKKAKKKVVKKAKKHPAKKRALIKKKAIAKKPRVVKKAKKKATAKKPAEKKAVLGIVTHYFPQVRAAVIKLKGPLLLGETIKIKGHTTDFTQEVNSMQIDRVPITQAKKGQEIGLLVNSRVRQHDSVYKV